jgi:hypothetical protein
MERTATPLRSSRVADFGDALWSSRVAGVITAGRLLLSSVVRQKPMVILFYEYRAGAVELQFEFLDGKTLGFITLSSNGVLSEADQRKAYGVTQPWPTQ